MDTVRLDCLTTSILYNLKFGRETPMTQQGPPWSGQEMLISVFTESESESELNQLIDHTFITD